MIHCGFYTRREFYKIIFPSLEKGDLVSQHKMKLQIGSPKALALNLLNLL